MYGTGQLPKFEDDQFQIKLDTDQKKYLIPTAEVILTNMLKEKVLWDLNSLPLDLLLRHLVLEKKLVVMGKDTKGMLRQHQFNKVELVSIVDPKKV